ncbi:MAG: DUF2007 domain-containing protein [Candidatus Uhrbacteria bacterium]
MSLILLKHFNFLPEAELAKSRLENEGIRSLLQKEGIPGAAVTLLQGADLLVKEKDLEQAKNILVCTQIETAAKLFF